MEGRLHRRTVRGQEHRAVCWEIQNVAMRPDGNGELTRLMGMLVQRTRQGMGLRSWRYSMHVKDRLIQKLFVEPGFRDEPPGVGLEVSDADTMLAYLSTVNVRAGLCGLPDPPARAGRG